VWTCKFSPSGGNVDISGVLKVNVHYYEDGNVQLNTETPVKISATGSVSIPPFFSLSFFCLLEACALLILLFLPFSRMPVVWLTPL
jgi:hypothetical protein